MTQLDVRDNIYDHPWTHLERPDAEGLVTHVALVPNGVSRGRSLVSVSITTHDGHTIVGYAPLNLVHQAVVQLAQSPIVRKECK